MNKTAFAKIGKTKMLRGALYSACALSLCLAFAVSLPNKAQAVEQEGPSTVKVTVVKYLNGSQANTESANGTSFSITSTASDESGAPFSLGPSNSYTFTSPGMSPGVNYSVAENLDATVAQDCTGDNPYALLGYASGNTLSEAAVGIPSFDAGSLSNVTSDKFIIVWNEICPGRIIVTKATNIEASKVAFSFNIDDHAGFSNDFTLHGGEVSRDFEAVPGITYTVSEVTSSMPTGWALTLDDCQYDNESVGISTSEGHEVTLQPGDTVRCTFTNTFTGITGRKFDDQNGSGVKDLGEKGLQGWTITLTPFVPQNTESEVFVSVISGDGPQSFTATTDADGFYYFANIPAGSYKLCEVKQVGWTQSHPTGSTPNGVSCGDNGDGYLVSYNGETVQSGLDFGNFTILHGNGGGNPQPPTGPTPPAGQVAPVISNEKIINITTTSITLFWHTDHPATSRVVYDTLSHNPAGSAPNYGYAFSTVEETALVTDHTIVIAGLTPGTAYYVRPVSHGSPESTGIQLSGSTLALVTPPAAPTPGNGSGAPVTSISAPAQPGQVLGAATTLPRTGMPVSAVVIMLVLGFVSFRILEKRTV